MNRLVPCLVLMMLSYLPCLAAGSPWLLNADSLHPQFGWLLPEKAGLSAEQAMSLHLLRGNDTAELAVAAQYTESGGQLRMELLTGLEFDGRYVLRYGNRASEYRTPARPRSIPAAVRGWFPQTDSVPANLLFFQIRFSKPMRPDVDAWTRVRIREAAPGATDIPFAWRQRSYWYDSDRVLQVMVHPGRVKSGIDYGGPLLRAGQTYVIAIDSGLVDVNGAVLPSQEARTLHVGTADHEIPHIKQVSARLDAGSADAIEIRFSEPMDYSGLLSGIFLVDTKRQPVPYRLEVLERGRVVRLLPVAPWRPGQYTLEFDSEIRDLGANTLRRLFEVRDASEAARDHIPVSYRIRVR